MFLWISEESNSRYWNNNYLNTELYEVLDSVSQEIQEIPKAWFKLRCYIQWKHFSALKIIRNIKILQSTSYLGITIPYLLREKMEKRSLKFSYSSLLILLLGALLYFGRFHNYPSLKPHVSNLMRCWCFLHRHLLLLIQLRQRLQSYSTKQATHVSYHRNLTQSANPLLFLYLYLYYIYIYTFMLKTLFRFYIGVCAYLNHDFSRIQLPYHELTRSDLMWLNVTFNSSYSPLIEKFPFTWRNFSNNSR